MKNFDLQKNISEFTEIITRGITSGKVRREIAQEYADHIEDEVYNLTLGGICEEEAFHIACENLGAPENYKDLLAEIHNKPELLPEEIEMLRRQRIKKAVGIVTLTVFVILGVFLFRHVLFSTALLVFFIWMLIYFPAVIRFVCKRISLIKRIRKISVERGFKVHKNKILWWLRGVRGCGCDLYVETDFCIYSVKLIGTLLKRMEFRFINRENYAVKNLWWVCFFKGYHSGMLPFDVKKKKPYDMKYKMPDLTRDKLLVPVLLMNPLPYVIEDTAQVKLYGDGDFTQEGFLFSGSGFIKMLSEMK